MGEHPGAKRWSYIKIVPLAVLSGIVLSLLRHFPELRHEVADPYYLAGQMSALPILFGVLALFLVFLSNRRK